MKHILATTSFIALLMAWPALAQAPAANQGDSSSSGAPAATAPTTGSDTGTGADANTGFKANTTTPAGGASQNDNGAAGSGSTTAPAAGATGTTPTAVTFPVAADAKNLIGKDVYGAHGDQVGEINNLLVGSDGRVHAAIVAFGGFLGIGEDKVAVPWDQLNVTNDRVTVNMSEDQIKAAPRWDKNKPGQFAEYQPLNK